jgi:hypothetical protein
MLRFLGFGGKGEKVSHVTVSGVWEGKGKGVTCHMFVSDAQKHLSVLIKRADYLVHSEIAPL